MKPKGACQLPHWPLVGIVSDTKKDHGAFATSLDALSMPRPVPPAALTHPSHALASFILQVLLHVKRSEKDGFLFDTPAASEVGLTLRELVRVHNLRLKVNRLAEAAGQLAMHGPMKLPEQQGLDDSTALLEEYDVKTGTYNHVAPTHGANYRPDPSERRTGDAPSDDLAAVIQKTCEDAVALTSDKNVQMKRASSAAALEEAINNVRGAVMIVYPMGLPDYDHVRQILEEREDTSGAESMEILDAEKASLWAFSKEMQFDKLLSDYCGKNDKSKVIVKLQKMGAGAPSREPVVSEDEQKAMIAFYHKKQAESEKMEMEDEDAYLHSSWANPKALKNAFTGVGDVSWRAGR